MDEENTEKDCKKIASSFVQEMIKQNLTYSECKLVITHTNEILETTIPSISSKFDFDYLKKELNHAFLEPIQNSQ